MYSGIFLALHIKAYLVIHLVILGTNTSDPQQGDRAAKMRKTDMRARGLRVLRVSSTILCVHFPYHFAISLQYKTNAR